jgi:hypothetical protein
LEIFLMSPILRGAFLDVACMFGRFRVYRFGEQSNRQSAKTDRKELNHDSTLHLGDAQRKKSFYHAGRSGDPL